MSHDHQKGSGRAGVLFLCMIGLMLVLIGGIFEWLMWRSYQQAKASRSWPQAEAVILHTRVDKRQIKGSPKEFRVNILYGYTFDAKNISSNRFSPRGSKWTKDESTAKELMKTYPVGTSHQVWVDPSSPGDGILKHDTKAAGYSLWFPAVIIVGGLGMVWGAIRSSSRV